MRWETQRAVVQALNAHRDVTAKSDARLPKWVVRVDSRRGSARPYDSGTWLFIPIEGPRVSSILEYLVMNLLCAFAKSHWNFEMLFLQLLFTVLVGLSVVLLLVATLAAIWERLRGDSELKKLGLKLIKPKTPFDRITYESRPRRNDPKSESRIR
jgi:hypothetical protein